MALDQTVGRMGGLYYSAAPGSSKYGDEAFGKEFARAEVSVEARDDTKARKLWDLSTHLIEAVTLK